jgi:hypothetical protein
MPDTGLRKEGNVGRDARSDRLGFLPQITAVSAGEDCLSQPHVSFFRPGRLARRSTNQ